MVWLMTGAFVLSLLGGARVAAAQSIGIDVDPETARIFSEMELTRLIILLIAVFVIGMLTLGWRALSVYRQTANSRIAMMSSEALRLSADEGAARKDRADTERGQREERNGYLQLLWSMQGTMVKTGEAITASTAGYKAQTTAVELHIEEARAFRVEMKNDIADVKKAVDASADRFGALVQLAIMDGMKASAGVFADRLDSVLLPISQQLNTLNARLLPPQTEGSDHAPKIGISGPAADGVDGLAAGDAARPSAA